MLAYYSQSTQRSCCFSLHLHAEMSVFVYILLGKCSDPSHFVLLQSCNRVVQIPLPQISLQDKYFEFSS